MLTEERVLLVDGTVDNAQQFIVHKYHLTYKTQKMSSVSFAELQTSL